MDAFLNYLARYHHIEQNAREELGKHIQQQVVSKDDFLLREGAVCRKLYFLESGAVRGYHYKDGREVTNWFGFESDLVTSFRSFIDQQPGHEYIHTIEDSRFWSVSREKLYSLYDKFPSVERLGRKTCEQYYIRLEDRYVNAHFKSASDRYQDLITLYPHILQRVPLGQIASFLGISQETLSRIRGKAGSR